MQPQKGPTLSTMRPERLTELRADFRRRRAAGETFTEMDGQLGQALDLAGSGDVAATRAIVDDIEALIGGDA